MILGRLYDLALWPHPWPWPWSFKVRVWKALYQEWGGRLIMNKKDVSHPFITMILTCVTMVRWADPPDSDRGDFRRLRAINISSFSQYQVCWWLGHTRSQGIINCRCWTGIIRSPAWDCCNNSLYCLRESLFPGCWWPWNTPQVNV